VINTIMMNYIALNTTSFLVNGVMKDPGQVIARTPLIAESARIPTIFEGLRVHWGFVLALLMAYFIWWLLNKTTLGFEIRTVGLNPDAAQYAGINVKRIIVLTMVLSGMLAGLAGSIEVTGLNYRHELGFSVGYGLDAIAIALLGKSHPLGIVLASISFCRHAEWRHPDAIPDPTARGSNLCVAGLDPAFCGGRHHHPLYLSH